MVPDAYSTYIHTLFYKNGFFRSQGEGGNDWKNQESGDAKTVTWLVKVSVKKNWQRLVVRLHHRRVKYRMESY